MDSKVAHSLYHLGYVSLHQSIEIVNLLKKSILWLDHILEDFICPKISRKSIIQLKMQTTQMKKPKHIALLFNNINTIKNCADDVINLATFSIASGIKHITVFSPQELDELLKDTLITKMNEQNLGLFGGVFSIAYDKGPYDHLISKSSNEEALYKEIVELNEMKCLSTQKDPNIVTSWGLTDKTLDGITKFDNTCNEDESTIHIMFVSEKDGKEALAKASQILSQAVQKDYVGLASIDQNLVHSILSGGRNKWPSPDLVLNFNRTPVLNGFLPWHLRYSEILQVEYVHAVNSAWFYRTLKAYSNRIQRYGK